MHLSPFNLWKYVVSHTVMSKLWWITGRYIDCQCNFINVTRVNIKPCWRCIRQ
jgi:hypothetical protein